MTKNAPAFAAEWLGHALQDSAQASPELILSTHLTVVVRARAEFADGSRGPDTGLVIGRQHCDGDRPSDAALLAAAHRCLLHMNTGSAGRTQSARRLLICIDGRWLPLIQSAHPSSQFHPSSKGATMNTHTLRARAMLAGFGLAALACGTSAATAGTPEENYRKERADCLSGRNPQDRATCLKEAGAALVEARRGNLTTPSQQASTQNALRRCEAQPAKDREDCKRLARGEGTVVGTVAQGAVIKELVTIQMDPPAAGVPATAASAAASATSR